MVIWDMVAMLAIILFGIPHGGFDAAIARRNDLLSNSLLSWAGFHLAYVFIAALVAILWWWFPLPSLILFLIISAFHFGASDIADTGSDWLPWLCHGGLITIVIPSVHPQVVMSIFALLTNVQQSEWLIGILQLIFYIWILCCIGYCIFTWHQKKYRKPLFNLFCLIGIVILTPPLVSFALYFCLWHSPGHTLRLWKSLPRNIRKSTLKEAAVYTLLAWLTLIVLFLSLNGSVTEILLQLIFIGLAALTWPHMILVDYMDKQRVLSL